LLRESFEASVRSRTAVDGCKRPPCPPACTVWGQPPTPGQRFPLTRVTVKVLSSPSASVSPTSPCPCRPFPVGRPSPTAPQPGLREGPSCHFTFPRRLFTPSHGRRGSPPGRAPAPAPSRPRAEGGGARGGGRRAAPHGRRGARALAVSPGRAPGHAQSRARARTAGRRRLPEVVASLSRTQGQPQRQPRAAASGAGAGTAGGGGSGGAKGSKMSTEAQRVDDSPSTSGGSSDGDQRESVQQEPEREQVQPKKKEGKISSKTAAKLSTSAKRIQKELAEITLDPPPNCRGKRYCQVYCIEEKLLEKNGE
uniref:Ubiquitin conjugating enzyme E2 E2 n=1 Tax=Callithrix jacchus TaxID=9483 RepID=A0A2R8ME50_CALJA